MRPIRKPRRTVRARQPKLPFNPGTCIACEKWTPFLDVEDEVCQACLARSRRRPVRLPIKTERDCA